MSEKSNSQIEIKIEPSVRENFRGKKIKKLTARICCVCSEFDLEAIILHKTRRQNHALCRTCFVQYFKQKIWEILAGMRGKIRQEKYPVTITEGKEYTHIKLDYDPVLYVSPPAVKCPGTVTGLTRNRCSHLLHFGKELRKFPIELSSVLTPLAILLSNPNYVLCRNMNAIPETPTLTPATDHLSPENLRSRGCLQIWDLYGWKSHEAKCTNCNTSWCRICKVSPYHSQQECKQDGKHELAPLFNNAVVKRCPGCKIITEKGPGCNKMICTQCHVAWCWLCETEDITYEHFGNKTGRCYGKLFPSSNN